MNSFEINNCYDSHTHFLATGQIDSGLKLFDLKSADDILKIKIEKKYFRNQWIYGFGWNNLLWEDQNWPNIKLLDQAFPDTPVFLSRADGHSSWINSKGISELTKLGFDFNEVIPGGVIGYDQFKNPNGILIDQAHIKALFLLPEYSDIQIKEQLLSAIKIFNTAGFTHVRDLSMTLNQARILNQIYIEGQHSICIEGFITIESIKDIDRGYLEFIEIKKINNPFLKILGLKVFVDGSLGSGTASISENYLNSENSENNKGLLAWNDSDINKAIHFCWTRKIEIAFHTIGDFSADIVVEQARKLSAQKLLGVLNLEHVQLLKPETIKKMKPLHVICHMQPCHWLSDKNWIKSKIGDLVKYLFQWDQLLKNKISLFFGSDSPIEKSSLINNWLAIEDAKINQIAGMSFEQFKSCHSYPLKNWAPSKTIYKNGLIEQVVFNGQKII